MILPPKKTFGDHGLTSESDYKGVKGPPQNLIEAIIQSTT